LTIRKSSTGQIRISQSQKDAHQIKKTPGHIPGVFIANLWSRSLSFTVGLAQRSSEDPATGSIGLFSAHVLPIKCSRRVSNLLPLSCCFQQSYNAEQVTLRHPYKGLEIKKAAETASLIMRHAKLLKLSSFTILKALKFIFSEFTCTQLLKAADI
jgi:hypothetical protein